MEQSINQTFGKEVPKGLLRLEKRIEGEKPHPRSINLEFCIKAKQNTLGKTQASKFISKIIVMTENGKYAYSLPANDYEGNFEHSRISETLTALDTGITLINRLRQNNADLDVSINQIPYAKAEEIMRIYLRKLKEIRDSYTPATGKA